MRSGCAGYPDKVNLKKRPQHTKNYYRPQLPLIGLYPLGIAAVKSSGCFRAHRIDVNIGSQLVTA